ncbi:MAG: GNAT family N-acetyltransferase [Methanolinea sp.]|jgi:RimJ/RimL family protein N-acetyltransferase|nr:GNAT family N-acetyltransferase [Methanolinea sp.]
MYQILSPQMADATAELYTDVFLNDEPMTRHHKIGPEEFFPHAREYLHSCADLGLSYIATDRMTGEVIAFVLSSDLTTDWNAAGPGMARLLSFFRESMAIIEELESRCPDLHDVAPGTVLHIFQGGARREYRGQGLVTRLIRCTLALAKANGFSMVVADCTGPASKRVCERCGFECAAYIPYHQFMVDGEAFFAGLPGGISLMVQNI